MKKVQELFMLVGELTVEEKKGAPPPPQTEQEEKKPREINPLDYTSKTGPEISKVPIYW